MDKAVTRSAAGVCLTVPDPFPIFRRARAGPAAPIGRIAQGRIDCRAIGAVAQLGERRVRNAEVRGSIPLSSTTLKR